MSQPEQASHQAHLHSTYLGLNLPPRKEMLVGLSPLSAIWSITASVTDSATSSSRPRQYWTLISNLSMSCLCAANSNCRLSIDCCLYALPPTGQPQALPRTHRDASIECYFIGCLLVEGILIDWPSRLSCDKRFRAAAWRPVRLGPSGATWSSRRSVQSSPFRLVARVPVRCYYSAVTYYLGC